MGLSCFSNSFIFLLVITVFRLLMYLFLCIFFKENDFMKKFFFLCFFVFTFNIFVFNFFLMTDDVSLSYLS